MCLVTTALSRPLLRKHSLIYIHRIKYKIHAHV